MTLKRHAQGYVLIMVLVVLLVLTLLVAGLYSASEDGRFTAQTMMAQRVAAARADQAAQMALAKIRSKEISVPPGTTLTVCTGPTDAELRPAGTCSGASMIFSSGRIAGPALTGSTQFENGAGQLYQWWVFKQANADGSAPAQAADIYNVYAEGYFGSSNASPNFTIAAVQAEISIPGASSGAVNFDSDYAPH